MCALKLLVTFAEIILMLFNFTLPKMRRISRTLAKYILVYKIKMKMGRGKIRLFRKNFGC